MKKIIVFLICLIGLITFTNAARAAEGDLLWSAINDPSGGEDWIQGVATGSDGVYAVGYDNKPGNHQWRIEKRNLLNGSLIWEKAFDYSSESLCPDEAWGVAVGSDGIYVVGDDCSQVASSHILSDSQWRIQKRSFAGDIMWEKTSNPSTYWDVATGVAVGSDGVYVIGIAGTPPSGYSQWRVEKRSLVDLSPIWAKDNDFSPSGNDVARGIAIDSTGIYVVGYDSTQSSTQWRMEKRSLVSKDLTIWSQPSNPSGGDDEAWGVAVGSDGVYVVGYDSIPGNTEGRIEKRDLGTGVPIPSWPTQVSNNIAFFGVTIDNTGIYAVGLSYSLTATSGQWQIEKRSLTNGSSIWTKVSDPSTVGTDIPWGVAIDSSGIYVAGMDYTSDSNDDEWRIEKRASFYSFDCGLRVWDGSQAIKIYCEPLGILTSPLRISKGGTIFGVVLVPPTDTNASKIRIRIGSVTWALRKM